MKHDDLNIQNEIQAIIKTPDSSATIKTISPEFDSIQEIVGGCYEAYIISPSLILLVNDDARSNYLPYNCKFNDNDFYGNILIVGYKDNMFSSINTNDICNALKRIS